MLQRGRCYLYQTRSYSLVLMAMSNDYEDGLKLIEELTTNAQEIHERVLQQILATNAGTEYLWPFSMPLRCSW
ncbi:hypothetical protein GQ457_02G030480 [Hibiscus cannabinus]